MKFIKHHLSLIFPLVAILLGLEFFIVFDRTTDTFEKNLKDNYSMIVITKQEMSIDDFKSWDDHVEQVREKKYDNLLEGMEMDESLQAVLPFAYSIKLNKYLTLEELEEVKENLKKSGNLTSIESFQSSYQSEYELFSFVKLSFQTFIIFMSIIGFFLIVKQMEVWNFLHAERMKVMEIFGASLLLRSRVLINMALIDAIISAIITSLVFYVVQNLWVRGSQIEILKDNVDLMFSYTDILILLFASVFVVMVAVYLVVVNVKEE